MDITLEKVFNELKDFRKDVESRLASLEKKMEDLENKVVEMDKKVEWQSFKFDALRNVLSVAPGERVRRVKNLSRPMGRAGDGVNSTRITYQDPVL